MIPPQHPFFEDLFEEVRRASEELQGVTGAVPGDVADLVDRIADQFSSQSPETALAGVDPYLGQALLAAILYSEKSLRHDSADLQRRAIRVGIERMRQALRDIVDGLPSGEPEPAKSVARWLASAVSVPQTQLAELLDVSPRTWQRWISDTEASEPEGADETRVRAVARVVNHLRYAFTGPGVLRWFERPHPSLNGKPPKSLLADPTEIPTLTRLAAQTRSMVAS